jgi:redox-regulated HSP33 family molecular chaperone
MVRDGEIVMTCEYCNIDWRFTLDQVDQAAAARR